MFLVPYKCPVTGRFWDAGKALEDFGGEVPDLAYVRKVLGLPEIDGATGEGFTNLAVETAYDTFVEWLEGKVAGADSGQSSVQPTESLPASAPPKCCP